MFYAGDEYADDEATSGPIPEDAFDHAADHAEAYAQTLAANERVARIHAAADAERQAAQDEYDEMYPQGESR